MTTRELIKNNTKPGFRQVDGRLVVTMVTTLTVDEYHRVLEAVTVKEEEKSRWVQS